jgi:hypothetical protein
MGIAVLVVIAVVIAAGGTWVALQLLDQHRYITAVSRARQSLWPVPPARDDGRRD